MKKFLILVLTLSFLVSFSGVALAKDNLIFDTQNSDVFLKYSSDIIPYNGKFICEGQTDTMGYFDQSIKMELQKYNGSWSTIKTWNISGYTMRLIISETYPQQPGTFRVKCTHYAGGESRVSYSDTLSI